MALHSDWFPKSVEAALERLVGHSVALWAVHDRHQGHWSLEVQPQASVSPRPTLDAFFDVFTVVHILASCPHLLQFRCFTCFSFHLGSQQIRRPASGHSSWMQECPSRALAQTTCWARTDSRSGILHWCKYKPGYDWFDVLGRHDAFEKGYKKC